MRSVLTLPVAIPLALLANRVRAAADYLEDRNKAPRTLGRLENLHERMMHALIWMQE